MAKLIMQILLLPFVDIVRDNCYWTIRLLIVVPLLYILYLIL